MPALRTSGTIGGGGTTVIATRTRYGVKFQNQSANNGMTLTDSVLGFVRQVAAGELIFEEPRNLELGMQGTITITGTAGDAFDLVEFY